MPLDKMSRAADDGDLDFLLARCRKGDSRSWGELVDRFQAFVYSIPKRMGLNDDDCADVFQATFLALHRSLDRMEAAAALPKWLAVTASREALRIRRIGARVSVASFESEEHTLEDVLATEDQSAEEEAVSACEARLVRMAVQRLNERCAKLLAKLYLEEESSYADISAQIGIPVGAIGPTRARCLEKLRSALREDGFFA